MKNKILICADTILRDGTRNTVSLINVYENIKPVGYPAFLPRLEILHVLQKDTGDPDTVQISLDISIDDETILNQNLEARFQNTNIARSIIQIAGMPLNHPGELKILVTPEGFEPITYTVELMNPDANVVQ